jgi:hypothetical protein
MDEYLSDELFEMQRPPRVERINGIKLNLGAMTILELVQLEAVCTDRVTDAQVELLVVQSYIPRQQPDFPV